MPIPLGIVRIVLMIVLRRGIREDIVTDDGVLVSVTPIELAMEVRVCTITPTLG